MRGIAYGFLGAFPAVTVLNLLGTRKGRKTLFAVTKPLLLSLLCLYCLFWGLPSPDFLLIGAFFACWVGDVLLMLKGEGWFALGGVSFLVGHVLFIIRFARNAAFAGTSLAVLIPAGLAYAAAAVGVMITAGKKAPKRIVAPMILYLACNALMNVFALEAALRSGGFSILAYAGALLFFLSDGALIFMRFDPEPKRFFKSNFFVMLTYAGGVFLIALGLTGAV